MATNEAAAIVVGEAVARALEAANISRRDAAEQTGIPLTTLQRRILGRSPFRVNELAIIASLTGVSVVDLVAGTKGQAA